MCAHAGVAAAASNSQGEVRGGQLEEEASLEIKGIQMRP